MTLWIVLGLVALLLAFGVFLVWPGAGLGVHESLPFADKRLDFRVRFGSLLARWLKKDASANHHFVLFGVMHVADYDLTEGQFLHELWHIMREIQLGWLKHVGRYLTRKEFRVQEERDAEGFQQRNRGVEKVLRLLDRLNQYGVQKRG